MSGGSGYLRCPEGRRRNRGWSTLASLGVLMNAKRRYLLDAIQQITEALGMDQPDFDSKDIFLRKGDDLIGLHAIGDQTAETGFQQMEAWCNAYGNDWKFLGSIYRVSRPIDEEAADLKQEGWIEVNKPEGAK